MKRIVCCALVNDLGEILLLRRTMDRKHAAGKWHIMAGTMEEGEDRDECLKRELKEELRITEYELLEKAPAFRHMLGDTEYEVNAYRAKTHQKVVVDTVEHDQHEWVKPENIKNYDIMPYLLMNLRAVKFDV